MLSSNVPNYLGRNTLIKNDILLLFYLELAMQNIVSPMLALVNMEAPIILVH